MTADTAESSSIGVRAWIKLFVAPVQFFRMESGHASVGIPIAIAGLASAFDRLEMRTVLNASSSIVQSWPALWGAVLVSAPFTGILLYFVGGWWNRIRARFCGDRNAAVETCRRIGIFTYVIAGIPTIVFLTGNTLVYESPADYFATEDVVLTPMLFGMWSSFANYVIVRDQFDLRSGAARFWFLILPLSVYPLIIGGVIVYSLGIV